MDEKKTKLSKFLSFVLRHGPEEVGVRLDTNGWVGVDELLKAGAAHGRPFTREELEFVVRV
jgi:putative RNA 2'-phosphotransferase